MTQKPAGIFQCPPVLFFMAIECSQSAHSIFMQFSLPCNVPQQLTYLPNCISLLPEVVSHISSMLIGSL